MLFLFADDTAIAVKGRNMIELKSRLQRCLDAFLRFAADWKIKINPSKTQAIKTLTPPLSPELLVNGTTVPWSPSVKYLGLTIDYKMIFRGHVESILERGHLLLKCLYPLISHNPTSCNICSSSMEYMCGNSPL
uniref:Reverse transcriptase domain-containing protein n=1 Tax=Anopheles quadriannulatus TaxID=34691 RepID=A0A182XPM3_ANOQN